MSDTAEQKSLKILDHPFYTSLSNKYSDNSINNNNNNNNWWRSQFDTTNLTHPHLGARHPNGTLGMVIDPTVHRLRQVPTEIRFPTYVCPPNASFGIEGEGGNRVLQKIKNRLTKREEEEEEKSTENEKHSKKKKILCMIYTVSNLHDNMAAIADTWGRQCDGLLGASNVTDHSIGAIDLPHEGEESYNNMWQKIRTFWLYVHRHYREEYDYFYICGDDTYVLVENLRAYVEGAEVQRLENDGYLDIISRIYRYRRRAKKTASLRPRPLIFGTPMWYKRFLHFAGGGGYLLNQAALRMFRDKNEANSFETYYPNLTDSREDVYVAGFFFHRNVFLSHTIDDKGGIRFGPSSAQFSAVFNGRKSPIKPDELKDKFGIDIANGIDSASEQQISFHLKDDKKALRAANHTIADLIYRYHAFLYNWCT